MLTNLFSFFKRLRAGMHANSMRDWSILLLVSVMVFIGLVLWNVWTFDLTTSSGATGRSSVTNTNEFNNFSLDSIRTLFANRAAEEAKYVSGVYNYTDPSL